MVNPALENCPRIVQRAPGHGADVQVCRRLGVQRIGGAMPRDAWKNEWVTRAHGALRQVELGNTGQVANWQLVATAAVVLVGLLACLSITAAGPAAAAAEAFVPVLDWQPCAAPSQQGFD